MNIAYPIFRNKKKKNLSYYLVFWIYSRTSDIAFFLFSIFYGPEQNEGGVLSTESSLV